MIYLGILVNNPWSQRFENLWCRSGKLTTNTMWEIEVCRSRTILEISANYTTKQDHAGFNLTLGLLGYEVAFTTYDKRHWNYDLDTWEKYGE